MGLLSWLFGDSRRDGSSPTTAIVVDSIDDEHAWMRRHCPDFQLQLQSLQEIEGRFYDVMSLRNSAGVERSIYFDITQFFGKS